MTKHLRTLVITLFVSTLALPAMAQPRQGGQGRWGQPPGQMKGPNKQQRAKQMKRAEKMVGKALRNKLGLSDAKATKVEAILKQHRASQQKIQAEIRKARQALRKLFQTDSNDQKAWGAALDEMEKGHKALAKGRDKQFAALKKVLTPKEQAKLLRGLNQLQKRMKAKRGQRGQRGQKGQRGPRGRQGARGGQRGPGPRGGGPQFGGPGPG